MNPFVRGVCWVTLIVGLATMWGAGLEGNWPSTLCASAGSGCAFLALIFDFDDEDENDNERRRNLDRFA